MRHTYATLNLQHDDIQNVSRTLGHSSIRTTMDIYGHVIAGSGRHPSGLKRLLNELVLDAYSW